MDFEKAANLIPKSYIQQAEDSIKHRTNMIKNLIENKKCPEDGWDEAMIEFLMSYLSAMDSNNFSGNCGIGERESRIACEMVARRHFRMGHGIGRSGDLAEIQPKAAGSSLMNKLTNSMLLNLLRKNVPGVESCLVIPMATGMTLTLCLLASRSCRPHAKYVLWPRIDQKSCFKCIATAGYEAVVIENSLEGDELRTDVNSLQAKICELGAERIAAIITTTSCFAPRAPDRLEEVAVLCAEHNIPHIVNNAYGLQSTKCMHLINQASRVGRLDMFVQSTDKNFMVPVGGSVVAGFKSQTIDNIAKIYPGRGSATPTMDIFITLLSLGMEGYKRLLQERKDMFKLLKSELGKLAEKHQQRLLETPHNQISLGITLDGFGENVTEIGSMLFKRCSSGARVITGVESKTIAGHDFLGWGAHHPAYPHPYLTAAAAIGMKLTDVQLFVKRLDTVLTKAKKQ